MEFFRKYKLPVFVFLFVSGILSLVQIRLDPPILLAERFIRHGGWYQIGIIGFYGAFLAKKMEDPASAPRWRIASWSIFSLVFFLQLALGIFVSEKFLMSGKLHLPVPALILTGPIYRNQISFMTLLFLSTVILSGPAWCSQLCYFGAIDGLVSRGKTGRPRIQHKLPVKHTFLFLIISVTLLLRFLDLDPVFSIIAGIIFGIGGLITIFYFSRKRHKMIHCILYCPIGTLVNYLKYINPFRMYISSNCCFCSACSKVCQYDALSLADITARKPGITCTLCGDCIASCHLDSIRYKLFRFNPSNSRYIYLFLTISLHSVFLALAKI